MNKLNDYILLKAIFNEQLHNAVMSKDMEKIERLLKTRFAYEMESFVEPEPIDIERIYKEHVQNINDEELLRRLI